MIDWLFQSTIDISILLLLVLILRNPVRRFLGANVAYWLWLLPFLKLFMPVKFNRPEVITSYIQIPDSSILTPVYSGPTQVSEGITTTLFLVWLIGMVFWCIIKVLNTLMFRKQLAQSAQIFNFNKSQFFPQKNIRLYTSTTVNGPLITGLFKPMIYLPADFVTTYSIEEQEVVIAHEIMHAKRLDLWAQFIAEVYRAIFWFNPLVHCSWMKFQEDQELACDYQVLKNSNQNTRLIYGHALKKGASITLSPTSLTFFYHKHERFIMISKHKNSKILAFSGLLFGLIISYTVFSQTSITLAEKSVEKHGNIVSYEFNDIPLQTVVMLVSDTTQVKDLRGLDLLQGIMVNAKAKEVHAFDFLDQLLEDNGLRVERSKDSWEFLPF